MATALGFASAAPADVRYVAIHGTGTPLGDPIEVGALGAALARKGSSENGQAGPTLGSVKACYGHTEGAAGVTGEALTSPPERTQPSPELQPRLIQAQSSCSRLAVRGTQLLTRYSAISLDHSAQGVQ